MVKVKPTEKYNKITVKANNETNVFSVKDNMSEYYAKLSERWASADGMVDGIDYSSKYYSNVSKECMEIVQSHRDETVNTVKGLQDVVDSSIVQIEELARGSANNIQGSVNTAISEVQNIIDSSFETVNTKTIESVNTIENVSNNAIVTIRENAEDIINRVGLNMFDTVVKDHILTYEESRGLALQGTWVYKNAIAGERYGYQDFYNKCLEEYKESSYYGANVSVVGTLTDKEGVVSGFSTANYLKFPTNFQPGNNPWEMVFKITTGTDVTTNQYIMAISKGYTQETRYGTRMSIMDGHFRRTVTFNGTAWDIDGESQIGTHSILPNTTYFVKFSFTGSAYILSYSFDNVDYIDDIITYSTGTTYNEPTACLIGIWNNGAYTNPWLGSIDLNESYIDINGVRWWDGVTIRRNTNGHMYYPISAKAQIDTKFNSLGMAWYYGIDEENERIFLPRNVWFDQMSMDDVGKAIEAGLPNITGKTGNINIDSYANNFSGALYGSDLNGKSSSGSGNYGTRINIDASRSSKVYGKSNTVQPNAVKKLLYICVGNTVSDTSWVDVVTQVQEGAKDIDDVRVQALTDLTNKENAGLSALANASNALRETQITNCIKEIPQRIKYTLEDGTLTVKAGSVVIVPYGVEDLTSQYPKGAKFLLDSFKIYDTQFEDGKFFVWAEAIQDIPMKDKELGTNKRFAWIVFSHSLYPENIGKVNVGVITDMNSGTVAPSQDYGYFYDTNANIIRSVANGYEMTVCFPIVIGDWVQYEGFKTIEQVFNGMGYFGSTFWVETGVKGLIPNGRNEDGTLNNIEFVSDKIYMRTLAPNASSASREDVIFCPYNPDFPYFTGSATFRNYVTTTGFLYSENRKMILKGFSIGYMSRTNDKITEFILKTPFRAIDYSDKSEISGWGRASNKVVNLTLGASGSTYTAPANGWIQCACTGTAGSTYFEIVTDNASATASYTGGWGRASIPVSKGDVVSVFYGGNNFTKQIFRFAYAKGEV